MAAGVAAGSAAAVGVAAPASAALPLGPTVIYTGQGPTGYSVTFRYDAPDSVQKVQIYGEWLFSKPSSIVSQTTADLRTGKDWQPGDVLAGYNNAWRTIEMTEGADGIWEYTTPLPSGTFSYSFTHDCATENASGCTKFSDPAEPAWSAGIAGAGVQTLSQVYVPQSAKFPTYDNRYQAPAPVAGTLENRSYPSPLSTNPVGTHRVSVYLPPGYDATRATPYPTLYLSHGAGGNDTDWTTQGVAQNILDNAIAAGAAPAQVVVSTDFNGLPGGVQGYADELRTNVIPFIEANYRVSKARADRAFGGLSAGGGRALTLLYDNTDLFGSYGAWSAASALQAPTAEQAARMKAVPGVIHFGTGLQDFLAGINANSLSRAAALRAAGVPVVERNLNGIHSWDVWRQLLDHYVRTAAFRSTTTTLSAPATAVAGQATTLKATVASVSPSVARPTGSVTFYATRGGQQTVVGTAPVGSDGTAQLSAPLGAAGAVQVSASYQGSTAANASSSVPAAVSVAPAQGTAKAGLKVKVTPKKATVRGPRVRLTATVKGSGARPTGTVSFRLRGGKALGEQELSKGRATVKLPRGLEAGSYTVVVTYSGDTVYAGGRTTVKVVVKRR